MPMRRYVVPAGHALAIRVFVEALAIFVLVYPMLHIYVFLSGNLRPNKRGFFCDDQSLKHPNVEEEITVGQCVLIWGLIVVVLVPAVELLHITIFDVSVKRPRIFKIPWIVIELYRILGYFALGALCTLLTTELAKYKIGRLRPYFFSVCKANLDDNLCKDENGYNIFVTDYDCTGDPDEIWEASKSFLSGHSSFSFFSATFLIVYLHARLRNYSSLDNKSAYWVVSIIFKGLKILRPFLQFGIFLLAFYIALSRITDYKHHPGDVVTGASVGVFFAILLLVFLVDLLHRPRSFKIEEFHSTLHLVDTNHTETGLTMSHPQTRSEPNLRTLRAPPQEAMDSTRPLNSKARRQSSILPLTIERSTAA